MKKYIMVKKPETLLWSSSNYDGSRGSFQQVNPGQMLISVDNSSIFKHIHRYVFIKGDDKSKVRNATFLEIIKYKFSFNNIMRFIKYSIIQKISKFWSTL